MYRSIERAIDGDPRAKEVLVEGLRPRIAKMAAYYARCCGEDADDLLQEAWIGLLEALPKVDLEIGSPEQYLIQCARWRLLDAIKRAKVRRCASLEDFTADAIPDSDVEAVDTVCVSEFIEQLKTTQKAVVGYLLDGFTWREAGNHLGCTSANIAHHVKQIRRRYAEWAEESVS